MKKLALVVLLVAFGAVMVSGCPDNKANNKPAKTNTCGGSNCGGSNCG